MRILLITDAWLPQVNGVVRTLQNTAAELESMGHEVTVIGPDRFRTMPCPGYREIRLSLVPGRRLRRLIDAGNFDAIHIATEGPLGMAARRWCLRHDLAFTTSYHTRFPEYLRLRAPIPLKTSYAWLRRFHGAASRTLVRTETQKAELRARGFRNLSVWPGGVDTTLFRPRDKSFLDLPRPIVIYLGRVAPEKSIEDLLKLEFEGSKVIVGDGPSRTDLEAEYPGAHFLGYRHGEVLARTLAAADVFVFPSRTDTLGLVMLEAMACGLPVAAYPVPGPQDVVIIGKTGCLNDDLGKAIECALRLNPNDCIEYAAKFSWRRCTERFLQMLEPLRRCPHEKIPLPELAPWDRGRPVRMRTCDGTPEALLSPDSAGGKARAVLSKAKKPLPGAVARENRTSSAACTCDGTPEALLSPHGENRTSSAACTRRARSQA